MKNKLKNFMMNPWTVGIGTGLILLVVTVAVDLITAVKIFSTLKNVIVTVWKWILAFLNFELKKRSASKAEKDLIYDKLSVEEFIALAGARARKIAEMYEKIMAEQVG